MKFPLQIVKFTSGPVATNSYLLIDNDSCVLIDSPPNSFLEHKSYIDENNLTVQSLWLTHSHWDHTGDANDFVSHYKCDLYINKLDEYRCLEPNNYVGFDFGIVFAPCYPNKFINEGDVLKLNNIEFQCIHAPGHTEGSICFINQELKLAFVGDVLFKRSIGRTDLYGGNHQQLINSIHTKLMTLKDDIMVFNGHGEETTIGDERKLNPFLN
jgi:glyoxylase-like metal-dependent hydrolase (beta-lactamase superfamily II)